jgi:hypothetical protein
LPDGTFSIQKSKFGSILEGLEMENVGIFYGPLEYSMAVWYIFGNLVFLGILYHEKSGKPACRSEFKKFLDFVKIKKSIYKLILF